ncbi:MAG: hypothetical protein HY093_00775 [Candidatus Liptonbacteria bacterium]|nr:hypothetical protein [Candidatus Liptonbacteria bacterium]
MNQVTIEKTKEYLIVKIPIKSVKTGRASISTKSRSVLNQAIFEGLKDIELGRVFGPFKNIQAFKTALKNR